MHDYGKKNAKIFGLIVLNCGISCRICKIADCLFYYSSHSRASTSFSLNINFPQVFQVHILLNKRQVNAFISARNIMWALRQINI
jgi:hypothetical protein